jgi:hypothetical protein
VRLTESQIDGGVPTAHSPRFGDGGLRRLSQSQAHVLSSQLPLAALGHREKKNSGTFPPHKRS